jgi:hypothetical protein
VRLTSSIGLGLLLVACGAASTPDAEEPTTLHAPASDSAAFLLEVGGNLTDLLTRPTESIEELEAARRAARGAERRQRDRDLARAHLFAAEDTEGRESRGHLREASESARTAAQSSRDETLNAEMDFLQLWSAWRAGQAAATGRAQRFVSRHESSRDLVLMAWIIRGEVAFADEEWDDAIEAYRAVLGRLGHPLYAFALYRTARAQFQDGHVEESHQALEEVRDLGCPSDASAPTIHVALAATHALSGATRTGPDGRERPASCPEEAVASHATEDERPPPVVH